MVIQVTKNSLYSSVYSCHLFLISSASIGSLQFLSFVVPILTWNIPSVQFSLSVVSDILQPHGLQHARPPCPSLTPGVYSNSCPLSQWCHPTISSSVVPFSSHFQSFQHKGLFKWASSLHHVVKVLEFQLHISPSNEYSGLISFRMDWLDLLALQGTLKSLLQHHSSKASRAFFSAQLSL